MKPSQIAVEPQELRRVTSHVSLSPVDSGGASSKQQRKGEEENRSLYSPVETQLRPGRRIKNGSNVDEPD